METITPGDEARPSLESVEGEYQFACVLESVTTLDPASYITVDDQVITVVGQCSFLANGVKQTITIALGEGFTPGGVVTSTFDGTDEAYANFATTGDPLALGNFMVPVGVEQTGNVTESRDTSKQKGQPIGCPFVYAADPGSPLPGSASPCLSPLASSVVS